MATLMPRLPSADASLCRLWQAWSCNFPILLIIVCWVWWFCRLKISSVLLRFYQYWWEKGTDLLPLLHPSPLQCHSLCSNSLCLLFPTEILLVWFSSSTPGETWLEALARDQRGQCVAFFTFRTEWGVLVTLSLHETNLKAEKSNIAGILSSAWWSHSECLPENWRE